MPDTRRRAQSLWAALLVALLHIAVFSLLPTRIKISLPDRASAFEYVFITPPISQVLIHPQVHAPAIPPLGVELRKPGPQADDSLSLLAAPDEARDDGPSIDWNAELERAVKDNSLREAAPARRDFGLPHHPGPAAAKPPEFSWDYAPTHRVESLPEGGLLINLNDRCVLVLAPLPFPVCGIGTKPANGELFKHMRDAPPAAGPEAVP